MVDLLDPRRLLGSAFAYRMLQYALTPHTSRAEFIAEYVRPQPGDRILDIGCGPADDLAYMPEAIKYVGFDVSSSYVEAAKRRWGDRGEFFQARVSQTLLTDRQFDIIIANGVIHHLSDDEVHELLTLAHSLLTPGGRLVSKDPVYVSHQRRVARFLARRDRGGHVRTVDSYLQLAAEVFDDVVIHLRDDMLRVPYDHAILVMTQQTPSSA